MAPELRAFSLVSERALDDRAVEEFARSVAYSATLGGEALGAITRRESTLNFGDLLAPIDHKSAQNRAGVRFAISLAEDAEAVLGVLFATQESAVALADVFFGGPGQGEERRLTDIEARAISTSMDGVLAPVLAVFSGLEGCTISLEAVREAPLPSGNLVELSLQIAIGDVSIDASVFAPDPDGARVDLTSRDTMTQTVKDMPVDVDIDLASVQMAAVDVQALADGDVIVFDAAPDAEAVARSGSQDLLRGRLGEKSGRRFLEVTEILVSG